MPSAHGGTGGPTWPATGASDSGFCDDADILFGDWNGDGKTDIACKGNGRVRLSAGNAYVDAAGTS